MERIPDASRAVLRRRPVEVRVEEGRVVLVRHRFGPVRRKVLQALRVEPDLTVRLDAVGSAAWGLLDGTRTVGQVHAELSRRFPEEQAMAARLGHFVGTLVSKGFLELG